MNRPNEQNVIKLLNDNFDNYFNFNARNKFSLDLFIQALEKRIETCYVGITEKSSLKVKEAEEALLRQLVQYEQNRTNFNETQFEQEKSIIKQLLDVITQANSKMMSSSNFL